MDHRTTIHFTQGELDYMKAKLDEGIHPEVFQEDMYQTFGFDRSLSSIKGKLTRLGWKYAGLPLGRESAKPVAPEAPDTALFLDPDGGGMIERKGKAFKPTPSKFERFAQHEADLGQMFSDACLNGSQVYKMVVMPDTHVPEHDRKAVSTFVEFLHDYKPDGFMHIGDMLEMEPVSHWNPLHPYPRRLVPQVKEARYIFEEIDNALGPDCLFKRFFVGNHEDWLDQYLVKQIPEVYDGLEELGLGMKIKDLLGIREFGYKEIPVNEILKIGDAHFIHGFCTGLHHALAHLRMFGCNIYYGHLHDVQQHSTSNVRGLHEAQSLGCLRDLNARFLKGKPNNWVHAFGIFEFNRDGTYTKYVPTMIDGKFNFNGKRYGV